MCRLLYFLVRAYSFIFWLQNSKILCMICSSLASTNWLAMFALVGWARLGRWSVDVRSLRALSVASAAVVWRVTFWLAVAMVTSSALSALVEVFTGAGVWGVKTWRAWWTGAANTSSNDHKTNSGHSCQFQEDQKNILLTVGLRSVCPRVQLHNGIGQDSC